MALRRRRANQCARDGVCRCACSWTAVFRRRIPGRRACRPGWTDAGWRRKS